MRDFLKLKKKIFSLVLYDFIFYCILFKIGICKRLDNSLCQFSPVRSFRTMYRITDTLHFWNANDSRTTHRLLSTMKMIWDCNLPTSEWLQNSKSFSNGHSKRDVKLAWPKNQFQNPQNCDQHNVADLMPLCHSSLKFFCHQHHENSN